MEIVIAMKSSVSTSSAPAAIGPYSQGVLSELLFVSGQLPIDPATGVFPEGGIEEQTRQSLTNIKAILEAAGLGMDNVVKTTVFLADMDDFAAMNGVYAEFFSAPYPARSAVAVRSIPKGALVESECIESSFKQYISPEMIDEYHGKEAGILSVKSPETMIGTIRELGIVPFFVNSIQGYSIEERTFPEFWFTSEELGPWDWKIEAVRAGDIAYGKFLHGKSSFATSVWYRKLMDYRRAQPKYQPQGIDAEVLAAVRKAGSMSSRELRKIFGVKKAAMDSIMTRLEMGTWLIIGDIERVYRGQDLRYSGWQLASVCPPEDFFGFDKAPETPKEERFGFTKFSGFFEDGGRETGSAESDDSPYESLMEHIRSIRPSASDKEIAKLLG